MSDCEGGSLADDAATSNARMVVLPGAGRIMKVEQADELLAARL